MKLIVHPLGLATILVLSGCGQEGRESQSTSSFAMETRQAAELPNGFFLNEVPSNAVPLSQARVNAKTGESIAFTGYIGGRKEPFTVDRAIFLVADAEKSPTCDDGCQTPWDACCTPSEVIAANSAAVQVPGTPVSAKASESSPLPRLATETGNEADVPASTAAAPVAGDMSTAATWATVVVTSLDWIWGRLLPLASL